MFNSFCAYIRHSLTYGINNIKGRSIWFWNAGANVGLNFEQNVIISKADTVLFARL